MPAVLFLLRAVVLVLMWGLVLAAVVAVRHDFVGRRPRPAAAPRPAPARPARPATPAPKPAQTDRPPKPSTGRAGTLVVTEGPLAGTTIPLAGEPITIGRSDASTLVVADDYVSTNHARLVPNADGWMLEDLGSTNGTFLGRQRVTEPTPVPLATPIKVGKTTLELRK
jgi:pSer/pThr/pTyr-binding forkhead associated (FHA) protein